MRSRPIASFDPEIAKQDVAMAQLTETAGWPVLRKAIVDKQQAALKRLLAAPTAIDGTSIEQLFGLIAEVNAYASVLGLPDTLTKAAIAEREKRTRQEATA